MKTSLCLYFEKAKGVMRNKDVTITIKRIDYGGGHELIVRDDMGMNILHFFSSYCHVERFAFMADVSDLKRYAKAIARLNGRQNVVNVDVSESGYVV